MYLKVLMIANFVNLPWETGNCRFMYLINLLNESYNNVELITTNFCHSKKEKRNIDINKMESLSFKLTLIEEPEYEKNISLKRLLYSHRKFAKNVSKYLDKIDYKPDVIYCAIPSLSLAKVATKFAKKNNIKFIIDIQDLWPEAFKMVFNIPVISNIIFYPMKKKANYIYKNADNIVAVSDTYLNRALEVNTKNTKNANIFL